jgi:hypothetical protein
MVGLDPSTFDYEQFSEKELNGIDLNENNINLKNYSQKMIKVEKILKEINNEQ